MPSPSADSSTDEALGARPRRSRPSRYSVHGGVVRNPDPAPPDGYVPQVWDGGRPRQAHPADVAQSALFEAILLDEIDDLADRAAAVERRWHRRCERNPDDAVTLPHELKELRQQVAEARRLLDALRRRFPAD